MKKPSKSHSDANLMQSLPTSRSNSLADSTDHTAVSGSIQYPVEGLNEIAGGLAVRSLKRAEARIQFRSGRCALLAVLLAFPISIPAQSLWKADTSRAIVADKRACAVGDLVTILVQENNTASKDNSTKTSKSAGVDASIANFFYSPAGSSLLTKNGILPSLNYSSKEDFAGGGKISNSEKITAKIAVRVVDVLPNSNLVIEGRRSTSFAGETQEAVLRGVVRVEDISPNNTLFSYNIADATIKYISNGAITDTQRKGWFTRLWEKVSPF